MATPPDKPTDAAGTKPPAPRKPATPRKTVRKTAASAAPKPDARKADTAASSSADTKPATSQASAASSATASAKPVAPRKPAAKRTPSARKPATPKPTTPRTAAAKPATPRTTTKPSQRKPTSTGTGRRWGIAAAVTAAGAVVTAGLLALRGSTPATDDPNKPNEGKTAHQADGTDSSKSFEAGIADEGTIPE